MSRWIGSLLLSCCVVTVGVAQPPEYLPPQAPPVERGGQDVRLAPEVGYHPQQWGESGQVYQHAQCSRRRRLPLPFQDDSSNCCFPGMAWARADYLLWAIEGSNLPPLLTESPAGTAQPAAGLLNTPGTRVLFGGDDVNDELRSGFRLRAGTWLDESKTLGIEGSFFITESQASILTDGSNDASRIIGRPFTNAVTGQQDAQLVSFPGLLTGFTTLDAGSTGLIGADIALREPLCGCCKPCCFRLDAEVGYRYFRYDEDLRIQENLSPTFAAFAPGTSITVLDEFETENSFHGALVGLIADYQTGPLTIGGRLRMDVGRINRRVRIAGSTTNRVPGVPPVSRAGGLLAQTSNIGTFEDSSWTFIPEVGFELGYYVRPNVRFLLGYTLIYLTDFVRAGQTVDLQVNRNLIPPGTGGAGPARPAFSFDTTNLWVQGLSIGVECRY